MVPEDQLLDGTFGQRVASIVIVIGAGFGGILLVVGAWLAAIETRGRLRAPLKGGAGAKGAGDGLAADQLNAIANIFDKARRLRGSISVVIAGFLILAIAMWGVNAMTGAAPAPTPTVTVTDSPQAPANTETPASVEPTAPSSSP